MFKFTNPLQSIGSIIVYYSKTIQNGIFQSPQVATYTYLIGTAINVPGWRYFKTNPSGSVILLNYAGVPTWMGTLDTINMRVSPYLGTNISQAMGFQFNGCTISQTLSLDAGVWTLEMGLFGRPVGLGANAINITLSGPISFATISLSDIQIGTGVWKTLAVARGFVTTFNIPALGTYTLIIEGISTSDKTTFITNVTLTK